ncbi:HAMP domain-containing histidine kinase [Streptomonospora sp. S1-112]|uniref:histidine kinase n=1 Tax=Streptomonospora mangrovi TaxID=2883123 RepID=A0A9X3NNJ1_9ACTN|nr:HAMP domain-containing sensor histidine kinase [Streptomonospora mangrovi]MDA0566687.1 HAMP domain-containing histidine kinase [Streptomonospora mangrovi]
MSPADAPPAPTPPTPSAPPTPPAPRARRLPPLGLARRMTLVVLVLAALCLAVFGAAGAALLYRSLLHEADDRLHTLVGGPHEDGPPPRPPAGDGPPPFPTDLRTLTVDAEGEVSDVVGRTGTDATMPDVAALGAAELRDRAGQPFTVSGTGGTRWRVLTATDADGGARVAAQSLAEVDGTLTQLLLIEAGLGAAVLALLGAAAAATVRVQLRPLHAIEATAQAIAGGDLDRRIPDQDPRTETGRLGAALNTMLAGLARAVRDRDRSAAATRRFVADASHELRTPLSSIRGFAELYRQGRAQGVVTPDERADRWMSRIEQEAARMAGLVDDLLVLARFDEAPELEREPVELGEVAESVAAAIGARSPGTPITVAAPEPVTVTGDPDRLRQVLENLVGNAAVHTPPGTPVRVSVAARSAPPPPGAAGVGALPPGTARVAVVTVHDDGPGIAPDALAHVFDRFYRVDEARSRGGAGLGLSISAAFVAAHDGAIAVDSAPGRGTDFTVALPMA